MATTGTPRPRSFIPIQEAPIPSAGASPPLARPVAVRAERQRDRVDPRSTHTRAGKLLDELALPRPRRHMRSLSYGDAQLRVAPAPSPLEGPVTLAPECLRSTPSPTPYPPLRQPIAVRPLAVAGGGGAATATATASAGAGVRTSADKRSFSPALSAASFGSAVTPSSEEATTTASASPLPSDLSDLAEQQRRRLVGGGWARSPPRALSGAPRATSAQTAAALCGMHPGAGACADPVISRIEHFKSHPELRWRPQLPSGGGGGAPRKVFSYAPHPNRPPPAADDDEDDRPRPFPSVFASDRRFLRFLKRRWVWRRK